MKTYDNAADAIRHSETYGEIAHCDRTEENLDYLSAASDGHADCDHGVDYWADDPNSDDGMLWRVIVAD